MTDSSAPLWPERYLTDGRIVIAPSHRELSTPRRAKASAWLQQLGQDWRRLSRKQQWVVAVVLWFVFAAIHPLAAWLFVAGAIAFLRMTRQAHLQQPWYGPPPSSPESNLAAWDTTEARVAGAASRAWSETVHEPAWSSPFLASSRATFDGRAEVDQITDLALRIRNARMALGPRPTGPAAEYWERQEQALENAARQLGQRADALIRYRDQAALLSAELQQLAELERLERSAAEIDGLTAETAYPSGRGDAGMGSLTDEIAGVRMAMTELVDLMTRTRAPLAEPPGPMPGPQ